MQENITSKLLDFRNQRDWGKFHDSKSLAMSLCIEASELLEIFLWTLDDDISSDKIQELEDEVADVFCNLLMISERYSIDIEKVTLNKIVKNGYKYPVEKFKGINLKYNKE